MDDNGGQSSVYCDGWTGW